VAGDSRFIAVEDAARYRDGLGVPIPAGVPEALLAPVTDPLGDLALRYARTHAPFTAAALAGRLGLGDSVAHDVLVRLTREGRLLEGEFRPGGTAREWTHQDVLRVIRRRSLAKLRKEVEPVEQAALCRFTLAWHGATKRRAGADALLDVVEQLQGAPLPASVLETDILPARLENYDPSDLDAVVAAGEVVWVGIEPLGEHDGRVALYLTDQVRLLLPQHGANLASAKDLSDRERAIIDVLAETGASFFGALHEAAGGGYPGETVNALWDLVWRSIVTNDTVHPLRAFTRARVAARRRGQRVPAAFRSRRLVPPAAEGRWTLVQSAAAGASTGPQPVGSGARRAGRTATTHATTAWAKATAQQLLARYGLVTRESVNAESIAGGFGPIYTVLKALEEHGRVRRGYFVAGLGATQFALPGALDLLRSYRDASEDSSAVLLSATDPANPYGATLRWPPFTSASENGTAERAGAGRGPTRTVGATVVLLDGSLIGYLGRGDRALVTWIPPAEPWRARAVRALAQALVQRARSGDEAPRGMLIEEIDGSPAALHPFRTAFVAAGFIVGALGLQATRPRT
jgi:ATP-dependent Lhr-like helicase